MKRLSFNLVLVATLLVTACGDYDEQEDNNAELSETKIEIVTDGVRKSDLHEVRVNGVRCFINSAGMDCDWDDDHGRGDDDVR